MPCVMSLIRVPKGFLVSVGGVFGLRYMRTRAVGSVLFRSSQAMRLANKGGSGEG